MFISMTPLEVARSSAGWLARLAGQFTHRVLGRPAPRFAVLTPGFFAQQVLYDRKRRKLLRLAIRDKIDLTVLRQIFQQEDYGLSKLARSGELDALYRRIVESGRVPLILDCGANCGMATRYFTATFPEAQVVAVEPVEGNLSMARRNNREANATFLLAGVGSTDSRASIHDPGSGYWGYQVQLSAEGDTEIVSINTLCARFDPQRYVPFMAKIDIEGFEADLFSANCEWIDRFPLLVIELHDWLMPRQATSASFLRQVAGRNRDFVHYGENIFSIANGM